MTTVTNALPAEWIAHLARMRRGQCRSKRNQEGNTVFRIDIHGTHRFTKHLKPLLDPVCLRYHRVFSWWLHLFQVSYH